MATTTIPTAYFTELLTKAHSWDTHLSPLSPHVPPSLRTPPTPTPSTLLPSLLAPGGIRAYTLHPTPPTLTATITFTTPSSAAHYLTYTSTHTFTLATTPHPTITPAPWSPSDPAPLEGPSCDIPASMAAGATRAILVAPGMGPAHIAEQLRHLAAVPPIRLEYNRLLPAGSLLRFCSVRDAVMAKTYFALLKGRRSVAYVKDPADRETEEMGWAVVGCEEEEEEEEEGREREVEEVRGAFMPYIGLGRRGCEAALCHTPDVAGAVTPEMEVAAEAGAQEEEEGQVAEGSKLGSNSNSSSKENEKEQPELPSSTHKPLPPDPWDTAITSRRALILELLAQRDQNHQHENTSTSTSTAKPPPSARQTAGDQAENTPATTISTMPQQTTTTPGPQPRYKFRHERYVTMGRAAGKKVAETTLRAAASVPDIRGEAKAAAQTVVKQEKRRVKMAAAVDELEGWADDF